MVAVSISIYAVAAQHKSIQLLIILGGIAVAASGWIWGGHYYQIASGAKFSDDEKQFFSLQNQLEQRDKENALLREKLEELSAPISVE